MRRNSFPNRGSSNNQRRDNPPPPEQEPVPTAVKVLGAAAIFGAIVGLGSVSIGKGGPERIASSANDLPAKADAPHIRPLQASERIEPLDNSLPAKAGKPHARPLQVSEPIEPQDNSLPVKAGILRARPPQAGDYWRGCNEARAAGTAPIYRDEPGYRPEMDGDGDGIACEPHRTM